jgi:hypothetical protein
VNKLKLYNDHELDSLRKQSDLLGDNAVLFLYQHPEWASKINNFKEFPPEEEISCFPDPLNSYFSSFHQIPDWLDLAKVKISQKFFNQQGNTYLSLLGFYSLPYCYAFADGAQVLVRSKRITEEIGVRLSETALFLLDCFRPGTFNENNEALLSISKVRLIHAFSRMFISKYAKDWDKQWGIPINQEDMIGTNLAFSLLVLRGMEKLGKFPGKEVHEAVLHYWKVIGFYLGINISYWPDTAKEAFELEKMIRKRHMRASEAGKILISALLAYYRTTIPDPRVSQSAETLIAFFVGEEAASVLGIRQTVNLPGELVALMLDLSFITQNGQVTNYNKTRNFFMEQSKQQFGRKITLNIPEIKRS